MIKNLEHSDKIAEPQSRGKLNVLLARDKPEIKDTVSSSTYLFARPSKNISLLISEGSDSVESNPTTSELRPKPDTGEIKNLVDRVADWETYRASTQHLKCLIMRYTMVYFDRLVDREVT